MMNKQMKCKGRQKRKEEMFVRKKMKRTNVKVKLRKETEQKYGNVNKTGRKERVKGRN
jgi:hypothetical protein